MTKKQTTTSVLNQALIPNGDNKIFPKTVSMINLSIKNYASKVAKTIKWQKLTQHLLFATNLGTLHIYLVTYFINYLNSIIHTCSVGFFNIRAVT